MPWRLIIVILVFALFLTFISLNLDENYKCDINFGFAKIEEVPVFITIFSSFALGFLCALPFALHLKRKVKPSVITSKTASIAVSDQPVNPGEARQKFLSRFKSKKSSDGGYKDE